MLLELALSIAGHQEAVPQTPDSLQEVLANAFRQANQALLNGEGLSLDQRRIAKQLSDNATRLFPPPPDGDDRSDHDPDGFAGPRGAGPRPLPAGGQGAR